MIHATILKSYQKKMTAWASSHYLNLAVFNVLIVILVLLHSAKYFDPYWMISINAIVFLTLAASVFLLGARSKIMFLASLGFWIFAGIMRILRVEVWAERISIYVFESFVFAVLLFFIETVNIFPKKKVLI